MIFRRLLNDDAVVSMLSKYILDTIYKAEVMKGKVKVGEMKDLLKHIDQDENFDWLPLLHSPFFVPENKKIDDLLYDFQEKRVHMAIIVNEYGETEGLATMEDIIEEIVGEINDEFDEVEADYKKLADNVYVFEAKTSLNDFCRVFEMESTYFEKAKGESETLAGLIIELFGRIPSAGEDIEFEDFSFKVQSVDMRRIKKVRVTHRPPADLDDSKN